MMTSPLKMAAIIVLALHLTHDVASVRMSGRSGRASVSERSMRKPTPMFRSSSQTLRTKVGQRVNFHCNVAFLGDRVITWHNESSRRVLFAGPVNVIGDPRLSINADGHTFSISNVTEMDAGMYKCQVEILDEPISLRHQLLVLVPPSILALPMDKNIVVRARTSVHLACRPQGSPTPDVTWRRMTDSDGRKLSDEVIGEGSEIVLSDVQHVDAGMYACRADNGVGEAAEDRIHLKIIYRPRVSAVSGKVYASPGADDVRLRCSMRGEPRPRLQWRHASNGQMPTSNPEARLHSFEENEANGVHVGVLRIDQLNEKDYGRYVCRGSNSEGVDEDVVELTGEPERPVIVSHRESSDRNSYKLRWSVRSPYKIIRQRVNYWLDGPVINKEVERRREEEEPEARAVERDGGDEHERHLLQLSTLVSERAALRMGEGALGDEYVFEVVLPDLVADAVYVAQVQATNAFRDGDWSPHFFFETTGRGSGQRSVHGQSGWTSSASRDSLPAVIAVLMGVNFMVLAAFTHLHFSVTN